MTEEYQRILRQEALDAMYGILIAKLDLGHNNKGEIMQALDEALTAALDAIGA